jgi:DNA polymerase II small subunit/DNA polymerase delta subunit B
MSARISGVQISWGIPSAAKTAADVFAQGIVEDFKQAVAGGTAEIADEDGDMVTRVDHGDKNTINFTVKILEGTLLPVKGSEVTFATDIAGMGLDGGRCFVESAEITYKGNEASTASITITHYPFMPEDA